MPLQKLTKLTKLANAVDTANSVDKVQRKMTLQKMMEPNVLENKFTNSVTDENISIAVDWYNPKNKSEGYNVQFLNNKGESGNLHIPNGWDESTIDQFIGQVKENPHIVTMEPQTVAQDIAKEAMLPERARLYRRISDDDLAMFRAKQNHTGLNAEWLENMDIMDTSKLKGQAAFTKWFGEDAYFKNHEGQPLLFWRGASDDHVEGVSRAATGPREMGVHLGPKNVAGEFGMPFGISKGMKKMGHSAEDVGRMSDSYFHHKLRQAIPDEKRREELMSRGHYMTPYVANVKKPLFMRDLGYWTPDDVMNELMARHPDMHDDIARMRSQLKSEEATLYSKYQGNDTDTADKLSDAKEALEIKHNKKIQSYLKRKGYDSIMYQNQVEGASDISVIVFDPQSLKSVFNRGTWSPEEASHFRAVGAPVGTGVVANEVTEQPTQSD